MYIGSKRKACENESVKIVDVVADVMRGTGPMRDMNVKAVSDPVFWRFATSRPSGSGPRKNGMLQRPSSQYSSRDDSF
jgi:hypothetical protein